MHDVIVLVLKGLAGGTLVVVFALLSEGLNPKRFAGLFGAAPSVAIAGLAITLLDKGAGEAQKNTIGMIAGGVGMVLYAAAVVPLLKRMGAKHAAGVGMSVWAGGAAAVAVPLLLLT